MAKKETLEEKIEALEKKRERYLLTDKVEIDFWLKKQGFNNYKINADLTVNLKQDLVLQDKKLKFLPINFKNIEGHVVLSQCELELLSGLPNFVPGRVDCSFNNLITLKGAPGHIGGMFNCSNNQLVNMEFSPHTVGRDFDCRRNKLTSLQGVPFSIKEDFNCSFNMLSSLAGAPTKVDCAFKANSNFLKTLEHSPIICGRFECQNNKLETLKGLPKEISRSLNISNNPTLTSAAYLIFTHSGDMSIGIKNTPLEIFEGIEQLSIYYSEYQSALPAIKILTEKEELKHKISNTTEPSVKTTFKI